MLTCMNECVYECLCVRVFVCGTQVRAISGSGQQHGSVYWRRGASMLLAKLDARQSLTSQLAPALATQMSPIWMDSSYVID